MINDHLLRSCRSMLLTVLPSGCYFCCFRHLFLHRRRRQRWDGGWLAQVKCLNNNSFDETINNPFLWPGHRPPSITSTMTTEDEEHRPWRKPLRWWFRDYLGQILISYSVAPGRRGPKYQPSSPKPFYLPPSSSRFIIHVHVPFFVALSVDREGFVVNSMDDTWKYLFVHLLPVTSTIDRRRHIHLGIN